ncbi:MAG: hypothetical protein EOO38_15460 [Cytophagaceae bacterium]|nr:MAG: hypothetical protein EOO38_15460 [Cytophagaceae bacterium]
MAVDPEFIAAVASSNVCALYYALCEEYPLRLRIPRTTLAKTAVLEAAAARELPLEKLRGPGAVYRLSSLPENLSLNVIIQGGGSLETDFTVHYRDRPQRDGFAQLCYSARIFTGQPPCQPPYPRPTCLSVDEILPVIKRLDDLTRILGSFSGRPSTC